MASAKARAKFEKGAQHAHDFDDCNDDDDACARRSTVRGTRGGRMTTGARDAGRARAIDAERGAE